LKIIVIVLEIDSLTLKKLTCLEGSNLVKTALDSHKLNVVLQNSEKLA